MDNEGFVLVPEKLKKPGVYYAVTPDGIKIPVIDISNPAFACQVGEINRRKLR